MASRSGGGTVISSACVLLVAAGFGLYADKIGRVPASSVYFMDARFMSANGLAKGADVDVAGVKVGRVTDISLDPQTQMAIVRFEIDRRIRIPADSLLTVGSATMTGDNALMIEPGNSPQSLAANGVVINTRELASLEQQVSNYIFGGGGL